ncbi:hypothetical protein DV737_g5558, partial [Chaetothyriales sp. CBS 132003]
MVRLTAVKSSRRRRRSGRIKANEVTPGANTKPTPNLLTLPLEILSMVFEMLRQEAYGDTDASGALAKHRVRHELTNFLLTCRYLYRHFAPLYWQKRTIVFTDPVTLANEFLAFASDTATMNLQDLRYIISVDNFTTIKAYSTLVDMEKSVLLLSRDVSKFREVINLYHSELKTLKSLTVELNLDYWLSDPIIDRIAEVDDHSRLSAHQYWEYVDDICNGCFGHLEKTVRRTLLRRCKNFHIEAAVDTKQDSALARNSLLGVEIRLRTTCRKLTLTFGRED